MVKAKKSKIFKGEKITYVILLFLIMLAPIMIVFSKAMLSKTNFELKRMQSKINVQEDKNESLSMKINELASLDKIQSLAKELGLSYNNNNIKVINETKN